MPSLSSNSVEPDLNLTASSLYLSSSIMITDQRGYTYMLQRHCIVFYHWSSHLWNPWFMHSADLLHQYTTYGHVDVDNSLCLIVNEHMYALLLRLLPPPSTFFGVSPDSDSTTQNVLVFSPTSLCDRCSYRAKAYQDLMRCWSSSSCTAWRDAISVSWCFSPSRMRYHYTWFYYWGFSMSSSCSSVEVLSLQLPFDIQHLSIFMLNRFQNGTPGILLCRWYQVWTDQCDDSYSRQISCSSLSEVRRIRTRH